MIFFSKTIAERLATIEPGYIAKKVRGPRGHNTPAKAVYMVWDKIADHHVEFDDPQAVLNYLDAQDGH